MSEDKTFYPLYDCVNEPVLLETYCTVREGVVSHLNILTRVGYYQFESMCAEAVEVTVRFINQLKECLTAEQMVKIAAALDMKAPETIADYAGKANTAQVHNLPWLKEEED